MALIALVIAGLATSSWIARPSAMASLAGWLLAVVWVSAAWLLLFVACLARLPFPPAIGALVALGASEFLFRNAYGDGFFFAVKPMYQLPVALVGVALGHGVARMGADDA